MYILYPVHKALLIFCCRFLLDAPELKSGASELLQVSTFNPSFKLFRKRESARTGIDQFLIPSSSFPVLISGYFKANQETHILANLTFHTAQVSRDRWRVTLKETRKGQALKGKCKIWCKIYRLDATKPMLSRRRNEPPPEQSADKDKAVVCLRCQR